MRSSIRSLLVVGLLIPVVAQAGTVIGLSLATQREERWVKDRRVMELEAHRAGVELRVQVANNDAARQVAQCDLLLAQDVEVLILAPQDAAAAAVCVDHAERAGVPVISYDRLVTGSPHAYHYLSFDATKVGALQGEYLARQVPKGDYVVLSGPPTDSNAKLFADGAMKHLRPLVERGAIRVVLQAAVTDWDPNEAQRLCAQAIARNGGRLDAVLAPNDGTAGGCVRALAAAGLAGKTVVTGQDAELAAASRILRRTQAMTVFKDTRELGRQAIRMAITLANGDDVETHGAAVWNGTRQVPSVLLTPVLVTRDNLDAVLVKTGYLRRENL